MFEQLPIEYFVGGEKRTQIIEIVSVGGYHPIEYEELLLQDKSKESEEYVYGVKEKFKYLKKINPEIEVLKKEFDLDL